VQPTFQANEGRTEFLRTRTRPDHLTSTLNRGSPQGCLFLFRASDPSREKGLAPENPRPVKPQLTCPVLIGRGLAKSVLRRS